MKFLKFIILISILLYFVINTSAQGANWKYVDEPGDGSGWYYDSESIINTPEGTTMVWTKAIFSDRGRTDWVLSRTKNGLSTEGYENLSHTIALLELNCKTREQRIISDTEYDLSGKVLDSRTANKDTRRWVPIIPESMVEALFKKVCNIRAKK